MTLATSVPLQLFRKYEVLDRIGTTGLATVYRAKDALGNPVALKVLLGYFAQDQELMARFEQVMAKVQTLKHPNIVPVLRIEHEDSAVAVVMDCIPWRTLRARRAPVLPLGETLHILRQVAAALDYAHQQGVVHRDLRPSNVFYDPETGEVKVSDFGTVALVEGGSALVRTTVNTPHPSYAAPEQTQRKPPHPKNDIYSLGALAYELLTAEIPFDALSPYTALARQLTGAAIPPSQLEKSVPPEVDPIVMKALSHDPAQRHPTCAAFVRALEQAMGARAVAPSYRGAGQGAPSLGLAQAVTAEPVVEGGRIVCPSCGVNNAATAIRCQNCWIQLRQQPVLNDEEAAQESRRLQGRDLGKRRKIRLAIAAGVLALLAIWAYNVIEIRPPLPKPATTINSASTEGVWTMVGGTPLHTNAVPGPAFTPDGKTLWAFKSEGPIQASLAVDGSRAYVATSDGRVVALDKATGAEAWSFPASGPLNASLARAGDFLYFGQRDGSIIALDAQQGTEQWRFQTKGAMYASFAVIDGALYTGSTDGHVYSLDAQTGELRWQRKVANWVVGTPAVIDGIVIIGDEDGELYIIDASNGTLRNQLNIGTAVDSSPVIIGDFAYLTTRSGRVLAVRYHQKRVAFQKATWAIWINLWVWRLAPEPPPTPGLHWSVNLKGEEVAADMATDGQRLFLATYEGNLFALDAHTGKQQWKAKGLGKLQAAPIVSGDTVIVATVPGDIVGYDAATGQERWRQHVGEGAVAAPVLAGGTLYLPTDQGHLFAIQ